MDSDVIFSVFKNIIIEQNKMLLKEIAKDSGKNEKNLLDRYLRPEFYLPIITNTKNGSKER
jgi:hypothetical protein